MTHIGLSGSKERGRTGQAVDKVIQVNVKQSQPDRAEHTPRAIGQSDYQKFNQARGKLILSTAVLFKFRPLICWTCSQAGRPWSSRAP